MLPATCSSGNGFRLLRAAALCALLLEPARASAGTIGFRVDTEVESGDAVVVKVTATHTGDEAAMDVVPSVEFLGERRSGDPVARFQPNETHVWQMRVRDKPLLPGSYAAVVRVRYADTNGYPFEIISVAPATPENKARPRVSGRFALPPIAVGGDATGWLELKKPQGRSGPFEGTLVSPQGLRIEPERFQVEFDQDGNAKIAISAENEKLLAGTSVNVFALVSNDQFGVHQTDTVRTTLRIVPAPSALSAQTLYRAAAAVAVLLVVLEIAGLRRRES